MNKIKFLIALFVLIITSTNAQIVTLNYSTFSSSDCNVFASTIPFQGILHQTNIGDVTKSSSQASLALKYSYNGGGGTQIGMRKDFVNCDH